MLPSFYVSEANAREWSIARAALYGAALGVAAGLFKMFGPLQQERVTSIVELVGAIVGFAVLCGAVAALRNLVARRLIWPDL